MTAIDNLWWGKPKETKKKKQTNRGNENKIFLWLRTPLEIQ